MAMELYKKAFILGNKASASNIALSYKDTGDLEASFRMLRRYVDDGGARTWYLAEFYKNGLFVDKDATKFIELVQLGAQRGDDLSSNQLGIWYFDGSYVEQDKQKANEYFFKAIRFGANSDAAYNLGIHYRDGEGVPRDFERATYWLIFAAKFGDNGALIALDDIMSRKRAVFKKGFEPPDQLTRRRALTMKAARAGDPWAMYQIGDMIEKEAWNSPNDADQIEKLLSAMDWFRKAASKGQEGASDRAERLNKFIKRRSPLPQPAFP